MAKSNASSHKLSLIESSVEKPVAELTNITFGGSTDLIDLTSKDNNGFRDILPGLQSFTLNIEGFVDFQTTANSRNIDDLVTAKRTKVLVTFKLANSTTGDTVYLGLAYVTAFEITSGTETGLTFTATFEVKGDITVGANS